MASSVPLVSRPGVGAYPREPRGTPQRLRSAGEDHRPRRLRCVADGEPGLQRVPGRTATASCLLHRSGLRHFAPPAQSTPRPARSTRCWSATGHADHCADLSPLLQSPGDERGIRRRALAGAYDAGRGGRGPRTGSLRGMQDGVIRASRVHAAGHRFEHRPVRDQTAGCCRTIVPNAGRAADHRRSACWPTPATPAPAPHIATMARGADLLLAEATHPRPRRPAQDSAAVPVAAPFRPASTPPAPTPGGWSSPTCGRARIQPLLAPPPGALTPPAWTSPHPG